MYHSPNQTVDQKLEQKGFIEVERPGLLERHIFKQSSLYFFLWHPAYEMFMSSEMSGEKAPGSFYINQQVLKAPAEPTSFENLCYQIDRYPIRFSPVAFIGKYLKLFPVDAIKETLEALLKKLSSGIDQCFNARGYAIAIIKRIGPNYNEVEHIKESRHFNEGPPTFEELEAKFADEEDMETYESGKDLPDDVPTIAELRAMICGEDKPPEPEKPVEEEKLDIDQICNQINQHKTPFNPSLRFCKKSWRR